MTNITRGPWGKDSQPGNVAGGIATGGEPPHYEGMEPRVAKLEAYVDHVQKDVAELRADARTILDRINIVDGKLNRIEDALTHVPTKFQIATWAIAALVVMVGTAAGVIAVLLRMTGHADAANVIDGARGK